MNYQQAMPGINLEPFFEQTKGLELGQYHNFLRQALASRIGSRPHGRDQEWYQLLNTLPQLSRVDANFKVDQVSLSTAAGIDQAALRKTLMGLHPWRKGPFNILGVEVHAEWRSDRKWQRIRPHLSTLKGRRVLDVGTGNGYFLYRMLGEQVDLALGIDPTRLFLYQFQALQNLQAENNAFLLPLTDEDLPPCQFFDTVFSLGVLYHRRQPVQHLQRLISALRPGGELVLETLIINEASKSLKPTGRYAQMRNVWLIPTLKYIKELLQQCACEDIKVVDVNVTSTQEQRSTEWMRFQSLADFLDPEDSSKTIEGYPAPVRAVIIATKPD
ncbi:MAG: tRNA 5-methoxyuridine(34)/uridine 5-oxyacetic acid(34) synthase CmoB [Gammaproteobacteria bacterium]|nr:tRNA 5-methoxyuridine(34)/uridine 5-oxyacetic acid(34) synthase CmoB [Gammaproteobacteria bacterium]MBT5202290.1 tRNA 5-methoxyuridine(34)/uridine 5-oxyacetic acid(34) synthase CmoB [Gammaproteobacteria bacterium]MBT5601944.1 tRNA 5-methoxyuridine(34)/uridine 5-oxyacetic acid(34) synthase CmoB [Gammaproteobacteria bacterium]MBT6245787.1 tRNA 5-methoxyuridine(34)/uridine 5-oxyacetic acid(34) synthase CmoB [Gammaproteobacteria bacterium]